ncbi:MAG: hydroxymethylglutaryl-CoA lyase [Sterolibacterium sp.]|jgi:hydroxymethylglutaryl-CoA lyase|nr:hydroxymethylglutaryl-CoA lyase [Sterolibacterium sp.]
MNWPATVRIVEVGPRDGLQNEALPITTASRVELVARLANAGLRHIEVAAFVAPKAVPQMADSPQLMAALQALAWRAPLTLSALVPNERGLDAALAAGVDEVAVFGAATEAFSQQNIHCSIAESLRRFEPVVRRARQQGLRVRGYVSCVLGCPYEGEVSAVAVSAMAGALYEMGCAEISLGDTIGSGRPLGVYALVDALSQRVPRAVLAGHFHDTWGMAIANVLAALESGITVFDASVGGLGGCPYAPGARGNVATEELVWLMQGMGVETGIDLDRLVDTADWISAQLSRLPVSRVAQARLAQRERERERLREGFCERGAEHGGMNAG